MRYQIWNLTLCQGKSGDLSCLRASLSKPLPPTLLEDYWGYCFSVQEDPEENDRFFVIIQNNGVVRWNFPVILKSSCVLDVKYFPWDQQVSDTQSVMRKHFFKIFFEILKRLLKNFWKYLISNTCL